MQLGFWAHMRIGLGLSTEHLGGNLVFMCLFMAFFSVVIALFKDIPDVRGDEMADTRTASVQYGVQKIFWACIWMLTAAYACAVAYISIACSGPTRVIGAGLQLGFAGMLWRKAAQTDLTQHSQIVMAYMFIWKLFYAQYAILPMLR
jgi:homogentisate phytyltransferase / homogentisate geranylgeranyltransferase